MIEPNEDFNLFGTLLKLSEEEINKRYSEYTEKAQVLKDNLKEFEDFQRYTLDKRTPYKKNALKKVLSLLEKRRKEKIALVENKLREVSEAKEFTGRLILTIEWKKSYMWGKNPRVSTNYGFVGSSIGGCGYDKLSTATAEALNNDLRIVKLLYLAKQKALIENPDYKNNDKTKASQSDYNRAFLGYGSGYGILPSFEGGVGVSCHQAILKRLGLNMECITSTHDTDVYLIEKGGV